jgi:hypothetical protein
MPVTTFRGPQQLTSLASSMPLAVPPLATFAWLKPRTASVYVSLDSTAATSADMLIDVGSMLEIDSALSDVRVIQASAGAIVDVWYFS